MFALNGESGIRTHAPFRTNGFQDRLVMTASISLQTCFSIIQDKKRFVKSFFNLFFLVFSYFVAVHQQLSYNIMVGSICQHFFYIFFNFIQQISVVCQKKSASLRSGFIISLFFLRVKHYFTFFYIFFLHALYFIRLITAS